MEYANLQERRENSCPLPEKIPLCSLLLHDIAVIVLGGSLGARSNQISQLQLNDESQEFIRKRSDSIPDI